MLDDVESSSQRYADTFNHHLKAVTNRSPSPAKQVKSTHNMREVSLSRDSSREEPASSIVPTPRHQQLLRRELPSSHPRKHLCFVLIPFLSRKITPPLTPRLLNVQALLLSEKGVAKKILSKGCVSVSPGGVVWMTQSQKPTHRGDRVGMGRELEGLAPLNMEFRLCYRLM